MNAMLPVLIGIAGRAGSGKDSLAAALVAAHHYRVRHFAEPLRDLVNARFQWQPAQWQDRTWKETPTVVDGGYSPRNWMQWLGTEVLRKYAGPDIFVRLALHEYDRQPYPLIIPDVRFNNEAQAIIARGGVVIELIRAAASPVEAHVSELGVKSDLVHAIVRNNDTLEELTILAELTLSTLWREKQREQMAFDFSDVAVSV